MGECGDHVLDGCLKKIVDEKSSFGNGWRFFYALKERGDGRRRGKRGVRGGRVLAEVRQALPDGAVEGEKGAERS